MKKGLNRLKLRKLQKEQRKKVLIKGIVLIILIALVLSIASSCQKGTVSVKIPEGASSRKIAEILKANDVIDSELIFLARLSLSKYNGKLQFGTFKFDKNDF